ncbi:MAG: LysM peptidoglycan-binding domain-containing protein [Anaerolineae bacterium]|nr:LysM peptidoglycan-binding domain-containing protein [Anaerolineae bacterium]
MALEKATVQRYNPESGTPEGDPIEVLFNPTEYRLEKTNRFVESTTPGLEASPVQFTLGNPRTLSMQLFFDTYEQGEDVRDYIDQIVGLMDFDAELHGPPVCIFSWGDLNFVSVLERAIQSFKLFLSDGTPVRATVDVTFKEYFHTPGDRQSADFAKRYIVRRGDTLSGIADQKYGDPALWRPIAEENGIDDPLSIEPGQVLIVPALE